MKNIENFNRIIAGTTAAFIVASSSGCGAQPKESSPNSQSITTVETLGTSTVQEPSIADLPTTRETTKESIMMESQTVETIEPTKSQTSETEKMYDLSNVTKERLELTQNLLNVYDNCGKIPTGSFRKFKEYLTPEQIISFGETGKGIETIKNINGEPTIALINCDEETIKSFNNSIKYLKRDFDPDIVNKLNENGVSVLMYSKYLDSTVDSNKYGQIVTKYNKLEYDGIGEDYTIAAYLLSESFKIRIEQFDSTLSKDDRVYASLLLSNNCWGLFKSNNNINCDGLSGINYMTYKAFSSKLSDEVVQTNIKRLESVITPYGKSMTWEKINKSLSSRQY